MADPVPAPTVDRHGPCICVPPPDGYGRDADCPHHGRTYADQIRNHLSALGQRDVARAELSVLRAREAQVREVALGGHDPALLHAIPQRHRSDVAQLRVDLLAVLDGTTGSGKTG